jgi:hypothetical protein
MRKLLGLVLLLPLFAWGQTPFDGTWKVNISSAKFGQKPDVIALHNGEYTCTTCIPKVAVKADGADHKVPGAKEYDTLAVKQVDDKTVQFTQKKNGKLIGEWTDTLSPDGKTLTQEFKDYPPEGPPVTGKVVLTRVSAGHPAAHGISGSWRPEKVEDVSEQGLTFTYKSTADGLSLTTPTGQSYEAKFDGKDYPLKGDRAGGTISLKKVNANTIEETYKQDEKPVAINEMTVTGNTMKVVSKDVRRGTTMNFTAQKQ